MNAAAKIVEDYLRVLMIPDPEAAQRYKRVKKVFGPRHVAEGGSDEETVVYQTGTLYGEWPDGTKFEGNRYVERYSAEWLLVRAGLAKP